MQKLRSAILWIGAALVPAIVANAAIGVEAAQQREPASPEGQLAMTANSASVWPFLVQALIVAGCATLLIARERQRSYR